MLTPPDGTSAPPPAGYRPRRLTTGLRAQILVGLALVTLLAVVVSGYLALWAAGDSLRVQRESSALSLVAAASAVTSSALDPRLPIDAATNRAELASVLRLLTERGDILEASVIAPDRRVVASRPSRPSGDRDPAIVGGVLGGIPSVMNYRTRPGGALELLAYAPINQRGTVAGAVRLVLPADAPVVAILRQSRLSSWVLIGFALGDAALVLALGGFVLTQLVVKPLQMVERAASRVSAGDLGQRVATDGPREIAALADAFNQMTASVAAQRDQLIRTEKLASVGQLAAGVAHEIGNPLATILGFVDILRKEADRTGSEPALSADEHRDALDRLKSEVQRINRIIQDLLAYSRPTHEDPQPTDPLATLDNVEALLRPQARVRNIRLVRETPSPWPPVVVAPGRLTQVVLNLVLNAADAMGGEGRIGVTATAVGRKVRLVFADDGPGIPPDAERRIFDPFFTTKEPGQGTGLGLPICRSIVESYGGTLELEPTPPGEKGARFAVTLPAAA